MPPRYVLPAASNKKSVSSSEGIRTMSRTIPDSLLLFCMLARPQKSLKAVRLGTAVPQASAPLPPPRQSMTLRSGLTVVSVIWAYGCTAVRAESSQAAAMIAGLTSQPRRRPRPVGAPFVCSCSCSCLCLLS
eukprot:scaffold25333_cov64-Phaeocystis_antarctica.AAC.7